jgi:hypothetical protein
MLLKKTHNDLNEFRAIIYFYSKEHSLVHCIDVCDIRELSVYSTGKIDVLINVPGDTIFTFLRLELWLYYLSIFQLYRGCQFYWWR